MIRGTSMIRRGPHHEDVAWGLAATIVTDHSAIIEHKLYWASATSRDEARYLTAILNSAVLTIAVRPTQARGEHNPRDFDKYIFHLPIPKYDPDDAAALGDRDNAQLTSPVIDVAEDVAMERLQVGQVITTREAAPFQVNQPGGR
jgi:3-hydroxy-3-methylglutaryl CoA synthase